jgi:hypothetical protein
MNKCTLTNTSKIHSYAKSAWEPRQLTTFTRYIRERIIWIVFYCDTRKGLQNGDKYSCYDLPLRSSHRAIYSVFCFHRFFGCGCGFGFVKGVKLLVPTTPASTLTLHTCPHSHPPFYSNRN